MTRCPGSTIRFGENPVKLKQSIMQAEFLRYQNPKSEKEAQIVSAAERVFAECGFDGATTAELARQAKVSVAGSGDATVFAQESLTISVAGSGDVRYYGDAAVTQSIAGSGSVRYLGKVTP